MLHGCAPCLPGDVVLVAQRQRYLTVWAGGMRLDLAVALVIRNVLWWRSRSHQPEVLLAAACALGAGCKVAGRRGVLRPSYVSILSLIGWASRLCIFMWEAPGMPYLRGSISLPRPSVALPPECPEGSVWPWAGIQPSISIGPPSPWPTCQAAGLCTNS